MEYSGQTVQYSFAGMLPYSANILSTHSLTCGVGGGEDSAVCGNTMIEDGESCDDGDTQSGDGCSDTCQSESLTCSVSISPMEGDVGDVRTATITKPTRATTGSIVWGDGVVQSGIQL